jgi:hypothetical protein
MNKTCTACSTTFIVTDNDLNFYKRVSPTFGGKLFEVPAPSHCYECRQQRKLAVRMERKLYQRTCDLTGEDIVSVYRQRTPYTVYKYTHWYSDDWDPMDYGREYDFNRPFFNQYHSLLQLVPRPSLDIKAGNENCEYNNLILRSKNCYRCVACSESEDCFYTTFMMFNKDVCDCFFTFNSTRCYECIDCYHGYNLQHCQEVENCRDSLYLYNCKNCNDCIGCVNLNNKQYYIFNKQHTKDKYFEKLQWLFVNPQFMELARQKLLSLKGKLPRNYYGGISNEDVTGDNISFSKNVHESYDCTYLEDCKYCTWYHQSKDSYDVYGFGLGGELNYEGHLIGLTAQRVLFSESCWESVSALLYCHLCMMGSKNLFGCVGLKGKQYCILNKQYSKEEYEELVPRIIEHMQSTGEWGEFFPMNISPFAYNETIAQDYYPLTKAEAEIRGLQWLSETSTPTPPMSRFKVPANIQDVDDSICDEVLYCSITNVPYKIVPQELKFYRDMHIAVPTKCPEQRYQERFAQRRPRQLHQLECPKCHKQMRSTFTNDSPELIYCEECYLKEMY